MKATPIHEFANDGGPLLVAPRFPAPTWEGGEPPSGGRVVHAEFRFLGTGPATDYDRACDVEEPAAVLCAPPSWVLVLREAAGGAAWLPPLFPGELLLMQFEAAPDEDSAQAVLTLLAGQPATAWQTLAEGLDIGPGGMLLFHAAGSPTTEAEQQFGVIPDAGYAVIGDPINYPAIPGRYDLKSCTHPLPVSEGEYHICFLRFTPAAKQGASGNAGTDLSSEPHAHDSASMS
jgi:hypothetical protein